MELRKQYIFEHVVWYVWCVLGVFYVMNVILSIFMQFCTHFCIHEHTLTYLLKTLDIIRKHWFWFTYWMTSYVFELVHILDVKLCFRNCFHISDIDFFAEMLDVKRLPCFTISGCLPRGIQNAEMQS